MMSKKSVVLIRRLCLEILRGSEIHKSIYYWKII